MRKKSKLFFSSLIIMLIYLTFITPNIYASTAKDYNVNTKKSTIKYGDVNLDGIVDMQDVSALSSYLKGETKLTSVQVKVADVDGDGKITSHDQALIICKIMGTIQYYPIGVKYGDIDGDGKITEKDYNIVVKYLNGTLKLTDKQKALADVNMNRTVNQNDAKLILQRAQGLIVAFPVESAGNVILSTSNSEKIIKTSRSVLQNMIKTKNTYSLSNLIFGDIKKASNYNHYCTATYVSTVLYKSGLLTENQINKYNYNYTGAGGIPDMLEAAGWTKVKTSEARPGDIINVYGYHTLIYAGGNYCYDETCAQDNHSIEPRELWSYYKNDSRTQVWRAPKTTTNKSTSVTTIKGIKGYYTSTVSGRKFTLYSQNIQGSPWYSNEGSFVTSQATIASGLGSSLTPKDFSGFGGFGKVSDFQTKCGCQYKREYNISASKMKQYLQNGKVIMIELKGVNLKTDNGSVYYSLHFVSVLDYKNENGVDKVYVHDPWEGSVSYGWANLNDIVSVASCFDSVWK